MKLKEIAKQTIYTTSWGYKRPEIKFPKLNVGCGGYAKDMKLIANYPEAEVIAYYDGLLGTVFLFKGAVKYFGFWANKNGSPDYSNDALSKFGRYKKLAEPFGFLQKHGKILDKLAFERLGKTMVMEGI